MLAPLHWDPQPHILELASLPARFLEHNAKTSPQSGTCHPLTLSRLPQLNGQDSITNALVCK